MQSPKIGVNLPEAVHLEELHSALETFQQDGFDAVEIYLPSFPMIIGGELRPAAIAYVKEVLREFPFTYTGHIDTCLDLRNIEERALQENVLFRSIDICSELGLNPLTLHFEMASPFSSREEAFFDSHRRAADYAAERNVLLCIENIEVEDYRRVVEMVQRMDHPNFQMTLDVGHLYLAANYFGHPYLDAVKACAPYVRHVHLSDNTGTYEPMRLENLDLYRTLPMGYRFTFGRGDIHLPPLWGEIPMGEIARILEQSGYDGIYLCEYYSDRFKPFNRSVQENIRTLIRTVREEIREKKS